MMGQRATIRATDLANLIRVAKREGLRQYIIEAEGGTVRLVVGRTDPAQIGPDPDDLLK